MGLFNRKKEEEIEDENDFPRKPFPKKIKDLTPENKKKRKEPPKPWGKTERLVVLLTLLFTVATSGLLGMGARDWKLPGLPRLKLAAPEWIPWNTGPIIIEGETATDRKRGEEARKKFSEATQNLSGVYGFYVIDLTTGASYGASQDEIFQAASLIKLPVIAAFWREVERGAVSPSTKYTLKASDKIAGSGSLQGKPAGTTLTYQELVYAMGKESDNTAFGIIRRLVGDAKITELLDELDMEKTALSENETSPEDIGSFFEELWKANIVADKYKSEILASLTDTIYEDHLPRGVPTNIRVAHKYGREVHVVNDAGIVYASNPFVIVIMSKGVVEAEADEIFPELVRVLYEVQAQ